MIDSNSAYSKYIPGSIIIGLGLLLMLSLHWSFVINRNNEKRHEAKKNELEKQILKIQFEKKQLLNQIEIYQLEHDSIQKIILNNQKNANRQIYNLHKLTNDQLRKIANE